MDDWIKYLVAFILGYLIARMLRGNGFNIDGEPLSPGCNLKKGFDENKKEFCKNMKTEKSTKNPVTILSLML